MPLDPLLSAGLYGGGMLLSGLGNTIQGNMPWYDQTQGWLDQYNGGSRDLNRQRSDPFYAMLMGGPGSNMGANDMWGRANQQGAWNTQMLGDYQRRLDGQYSPAALFEAYSRTMDPRARQLATGAAQDATSRFGTSMMDLAQRQSQESVRRMENSMSRGGLFGGASGAAAAALQQGAAEPLMNAQNNINEMYSGAWQNAYNPMMQSGLAAQYAQPGNFLAGIQAGQGQQQLFGNQAQGLSNLMNDQSQQYLLAPSLAQRQSFLGNLMSGLGGAAQSVGSFGLGGMLNKGAGEGDGIDRIGSGFFGNQGQGGYDPWANGNTNISNNPFATSTRGRDNTYRYRP